MDYKESSPALGPAACRSPLLFLRGNTFSLPVVVNTFLTAANVSCTYLYFKMYLLTATQRKLSVPWSHAKTVSFTQEKIQAFKEAQIARLVGLP